MTNRILAPCLFACILAIPHTTAFAQDDHMGVFKSLVGTWKISSVIRPSQAAPEKSTGSGELTGNMILNDRFFRYEGYGTAPRIGRQDYRVIMTYDERKRTYRRWVFRSDGVTAESTGVWNADKRTMTWSTIGLPENTTFTVTTKITESGFEETLHGKRADGTVLMDLTMTAKKIQ